MTTDERSAVSTSFPYHRRYQPDPSNRFCRVHSARVAQPRALSMRRQRGSTVPRCPRAPFTSFNFGSGHCPSPIVASDEAAHWTRLRAGSDPLVVNRASPNRRTSWPRRASTDPQPILQLCRLSFTGDGISLTKVVRKEFDVGRPDEGPSWKTAFITGAASGIGLGVATALAQAGAKV